MSRGGLVMAAGGAVRPGQIVRRAAAIAALLGAFADPVAAEVTPRVRVIVRPGAVRLGERAIYRAELIVEPGAEVKWTPPEAGGAFTWGEARIGRRAGGARGRAALHGAATPDTAWIEIPLQVFALGVASVPGVRFETGPTPDARRQGRAPTGRLVVMPVLTPADSQATLRPVHGPLAAPWWERVPWLRVAAVVAALVLVAAMVTWWIRRRRKALPAAAAAAAATPRERALTELAELRAARLPEQGRVGDHAFRLGQILRRFLEATLQAPRPGDTTPQLVARLAQAGLPEDDLRRLAALLRGWDRVKFARQPCTTEEAARGEEAVEAFLRRPARSEPEPRAA